MQKRNCSRSILPKYFDSEPSQEIKLWFQKGFIFFPKLTSPQLFPPSTPKLFWKGIFEWYFLRKFLLSYDNVSWYNSEAEHTKEMFGNFIFLEESSQQ